MVQERDSRFGNALNRILPASDTRGSGVSAPANSGQNSAIDSAVEENRQDFGLSADTVGTAQQKLLNEINLDKPKNFLDKSVLAGTKWGVVDVGGVKFVNPLKTVFSGLDAIQNEVVSPISGYAIGNTSVWLSQITNWSSAHKIADQFQRKMDTTTGGFFEQRQALKEFNEERIALFWGEKFVSSIAFDPTTYLGFGWAMKLPKLFKPLGIAGKQVPILGPLEKGWVDAWNLPFKVGARAYRGEVLFKMPDYLGGGAAKLPGALGKGVPMSARQKAQQHGESVFQDTGEFIRKATGGKPVDQVTSAEIKAGLAQVLDPTVHYNMLPGNEARRMRDILLENPKLSAEQAGRVVTSVAGTERIIKTGSLAGKSESPVVREVVQYLQQNGADIAEDSGVRFAMSDIRDWYIAGRISKGEASEQLARLTGAPLDDITKLKIEGQLDTWMTGTYKNAGFIIDDETPRGVMEALRSKAVRTFQKDSDNGFHERMQRLGIMGAMVGNLDSAQKALYQRGLRKWVISPLSKMVLTFPLFPVQNAMEDGIRQWLGQSSRGFRTVGQYNRLVGGNFQVPSGLTRTGQDILGTRVQASRTALIEEESATLRDFANKLHAAGALDKVEQVFDHPKWGGVAKWLDPRHWTEISNVWSANARRHYHTERIIKHHTAMYGEEAVLRDMRDILLNAPGNLPKSEIDRLTSDLAVAGMTGNKEAVLSVADDYTGAVIQDIDVNKLVDKYFGGNELTPSSRKYIQEWKEQGARTSDVDRVVSQIEENEYADFVNGLGGFEAQMDMSIDLLNNSRELLTNVPLAERTADHVLQAEHAASSAIQALSGMEQRISQILQRATVRSREIAFNATKKEEIVRRAHQQINGTLSRMLKRKGDYVDAIRKLEAEAFDGGGYGLADSFIDQFDILEAGWRQDRQAVAELFERFNGQPKGESFWTELGNTRSEIQTTMQAQKRRAEAVLEQKRKRELQRRGPVPAPPDVQTIEARLHKAKSYTIHDLAEITGEQGENVTQAFMQGIWLNKADFVDHFVVRAGVNGIKDVDVRKIGGVYDRIMKSLALDDTMGASFMKNRQNIRQFGSDLKATAQAPAFRPEQEDSVKAFIQQFADQLGNKSPDELAQIKRLGQQGVDSATDDMNLAFVNYDGQRGVDDIMQSLFPFWTYEARRMPFLLRTSLTNPVVWNTFGPEGNYWSNTDDGYVHPAFAPWMDVNIFGGTLLNAPRRLKKGDMPPEHEGGVRGAISGFEQQIAQGGFYFGPHMTFLFDTILEGDLAEAAGQSAPPPVTGGLAGAQWLAEAFHIPVIGDGLRKMRFSVMPDKFRDYEAAKIIWDLGGNPSEVDFDNWTVRNGATRTTQEMINSALHKSAAVEWIREAAGMVRYRGDAEREYREARDTIQMSWTGLTKSELDEAKRQGIPLTSIVPMPPKVARILNELEGAEEFNGAVSLLSTGEKARIQNLSREMWDTYGTLKDEADRGQNEDDLAWFTGEMAPSVWRDRMSSRKQAIGGFIDQVRGFTRDPLTGEKVELQGEFRYREVPTNYEDYVALQKKLGNDTIRLQHPTSQALEMYYGIAPVDRDGDGVPEWNEFFKAREGVLAKLPPELRREVLAELEEKQTEPERALADLQRGILGDYWEVDDIVAEQMGVSSLLGDLRKASGRDPETAEILRGLPIMTQYRAEVQRRKDLLRLQSPELDYALNVFGFTGDTLRFKNPQSRLWWQQGNGVQRNVPFLGYLTGVEPAAPGRAS